MDEGWVLPALKTNEDPADTPDVSDFIAFGSTVGATSESTFAEDMDGIVDVAMLLRYMAVDRALRNWDGITAFYSPTSPHNFYWYHDNGPTALFHLVPWDLDNTLWAFDPYMDPQQWITVPAIPDWNVKPLSCEPMDTWTAGSDVKVTPPGCDTLTHMLAKSGWEEFATIGQEFLDTLFIYEDMNASITEWAAQIAPALVDDPYVNDAEWSQDVADFRSILQDAIFTFTQHLDEGYIVEEAWVEPGETELNAPISESGLVYDMINNFEFTGGAADVLPVFM